MDGLPRCSSYIGRYNCDRPIHPGALANGEGLCSDHATVPTRSNVDMGDFFPSVTTDCIPESPIQLMYDYLHSIRVGGMPVLINLDEWAYSDEIPPGDYSCMRAHTSERRKILPIRILELISTQCKLVDIRQVIPGCSGLSRKDIIELKMDPPHYGQVFSLLKSKIDSLSATRISLAKRSIELLALYKGGRCRQEPTKPPRFTIFKRMYNELIKMDSETLFSISATLRKMVGETGHIEAKMRLSHSLIIKSIPSGSTIVLDRDNYMNEEMSADIAAKLSIKPRPGHEEELPMDIKTKIAHLVDPKTELKMVRTSGKSYGISHLEKIAERLHISPIGNKKYMVDSIIDRLLPPVIVLIGDSSSDLAMSMVCLTSYELDLQSIESHVKVKSPPKSKIPTNIRTSVWREGSGSRMDTDCFCCGADIKWEKWHCGHIISEKNGGSICKDNLRPICASCNLKMGACNMYEYMVHIGREDKVPVYARSLFISIRSDTDLCLKLAKKYHQADYKRIERALRKRSTPFKMRMALISDIKNSIRC